MYIASIDVNVGFNQSLYLVSESDEFVEICVNLQSEAPLERSITTEIVVLPSTATRDNDFIAESSMELTFSQIEMQCFDISINTDMLLEERELFSVVLVPSDPGVNVAQQYATIAIADSESNNKIL